ncbi:MAG: hypothetical protein ACQETE_07995 [Bacteroidota bacterium]
MIEKIEHGEITFAIIIRKNFKAEGIQFFTPDEYSQQLAYMKREKGYVIDPHYHNLVPREVTYTQEVLFIKSGKVLVDFYDNAQNHIKSTTVEEGDVILLATGGHGFTMLEESEIIEVKQGPYMGDEDKTRFKPDNE